MRRLQSFPALATTTVLFLGLLRGGYTAVTPLSSSSPVPLVLVPSECESRTINWITHALPQQCLRTDRSVLGRAEKSAGHDDVGSTGATRTVEELRSSLVHGGSLEVTGGRAKENAARNGTVTASITSTETVLQQEGTSTVASSTATVSTTEHSIADGVLEPEAEPDSESPLDNANFLSFEEWKKQNLAKAGQNLDSLAERRPSTGGDTRRRPGGISNALDSLGEDGELELDFAQFVRPSNSHGGKADGGGATKSHATAQTDREGRVEGSDPAVITKEDPPHVRASSKDAGMTCLERFNYASFDCAATVLKTNAESKAASAILVENKDSYMLNECAAVTKFVVVELCNDILVDTVVLANFEFFSSMFRSFRLSVSDRYPVKADRWKELGVFEARNTRAVQPFRIENPLIWARYLRVELLTHYGNEYYCPLSLLRVHGTTMMEEFRHQEEEAARGDGDEDERESAEPAPGSAEAMVPEAVAEDVKMEAEAAARASEAEAEATPEPASADLAPPAPANAGTPDSKPSSAALTPLTHQLARELEHVLFSSDRPVCLPHGDSAGDTADPTGVLLEEVVGNATMAAPNFTAQKSVDTSVSKTVSTSETGEVKGSAVDEGGRMGQSVAADEGALDGLGEEVTRPASRDRETSSPSSDTRKTASTSSDKQTSSHSSSNQQVSSPSVSFSSYSSSSSSHSSSSSAPSSPSSSSTSVITNTTTISSSKPPTSATHPPPANPTTQESFFKQIHKRLQLLEANSTLSLQYIEEQSRILRDAFVKVEKKQLAKTATFLEYLNGTVLAELGGFRQQYDQLWQSTILELEAQRETSARELLAFSNRLSMLADESLFQKRISVLQFLLLLLCLALILFSRSHNTTTTPTTVATHVSGAPVSAVSPSLQGRTRPEPRAYVDLPIVHHIFERSRSYWDSPLASPASTRPSSSAGPDPASTAAAGGVSRQRSWFGAGTGTGPAHRRARSEDAVTYVDSGTDADGEEATAAVDTALVVGAEEDGGAGLSPPATPHSDHVL